MPVFSTANKNIYFLIAGVCLSVLDAALSVVFGKVVFPNFRFLFVLTGATVLFDFTCGWVVFFTLGESWAFTPEKINNAPIAAAIFFIVE
jgi:hypothetical protein